MKKLISMVIVISLMCSATMAFANGIETEEETVNCEIIEEQHNIDVNQGITGFGNIDVECCENISEEDEKDFCTFTRGNDDCKLCGLRQRRPGRRAPGRRKVYPQSRYGMPVRSV